MYLERKDQERWSAFYLLVVKTALILNGDLTMYEINKLGKRKTDRLV
jgi:hypothetical protein